MNMEFLPKHILLVDDDQVLNLIHHAVIQKLNVTSSIKCFTNGKDAFSYMLSSPSTQNNTLIFLDLFMPGYSGWDFLNDFHELEEETRESFKIVILSSSIDPEDRERAKNFDAVIHFQEKPLTRQTIDIVLKRFQEKSNLQGR